MRALQELFAVRVDSHIRILQGILLLLSLTVESTDFILEFTDVTLESADVTLEFTVVTLESSDVILEFTDHCITFFLIESGTIVVMSQFKIKQYQIQNLTYTWS